MRASVLVAVASRHGATREIAEAVGASLRRSGLEATVIDLDEAPDRPIDVADHDAVVLGSAIYMGRWRRSARDFVEAHRSALAARPLWLFSSGPLGDPPEPAEDHAVELDDLIADLMPYEHRIFTGRLDRAALGVREKAVVRIVKAPEGDFRDWDEIFDWARSITEALRGDAVEGRPGGLSDGAT